MALGKKPVVPAPMVQQQAPQNDGFGDFGNFGAFEEPKADEDDGFGDFGNFEDAPAVATTKQPSDDGFGDFGNFDGPKQQQQASEVEDDPFAEALGGFKQPDPVKQEDSGFGGFGDFDTSVPKPAPVEEKPKQDPIDYKFTDFSTAKPPAAKKEPSDDGFGDFGDFGAASEPVSSQPVAK